MPKGYFTPFTPAQEQQIKKEYLQKPVKRLAKELGTTHGRIMRFLNKHQLVIPKHIVEQRKKANQKKPGNIPFNKGKKQTEYMSAEAIEKSKRTRFKKGQLPHNTKHNGAIVTRKDNNGIYYQYIRIKKGVWELLHRHVWQCENGPIPNNKIVVFKDGNQNNVELNNLELISKNENMLRNSKHHFPEEIIPTMALISELNNQLKNQQHGTK